MTSVELARNDSAARRFMLQAVQALRRTRRYQVLAAVAFGLIMSVADIISFLKTMVLDAHPISMVVYLASTVVKDQIRAIVLMAAIVIADDAVERGSSTRRAYVAAALGGALIGVFLANTLIWPVNVWMMATNWPAHWLRGAPLFALLLIFEGTHWLLVGSAAVFLYADRRAARRTEARLRAAELNRIRRSKLALESRLQAMQARVEPQFLFNTLEQVERLFEIDAPTAARTLDDLIAYLRAAMPRMRDTSSTLAQELDLARAYLDIVRVRLGDRLCVTIDVPPGIGDARMPPMMVLPLVDHTIVRGLGPASDGGAIRIAASVDGDRLRMTIVDSGAAFVPEAEGDGIAAIRQRLDALFGPDATLELRRTNDAGSTEAVLDLPLERAELA